jgi:hypothetical protein
MCRVEIGGLELNLLAFFKSEILVYLTLNYRFRSRIEIQKQPEPSQSLLSNRSEPPDCAEKRLGFLCLVDLLQPTVFTLTPRRA